MLRRGVIDRFRARAGKRVVGVYAAVEPNPTVTSVVSACEEVANLYAATIVGIGGGSVLDTAKAISAQLSAEAGWLRAHLLQKFFK
jgi:alcohol dehydrogenase class IV